MGNWLKQTFPLMNLWLNNWVFLDEKKILKKFQSSSSKLLPKLKPTPVCLKFCCCWNCSPVCSRERTHLPAPSWYCSWTTPLQWRGKGKPMLWTHGCSQPTCAAAMGRREARSSKGHHFWRHKCCMSFVFLTGNNVQNEHLCMLSSVLPLKNMSTPQHP